MQWPNGKLEVNGGIELSMPGCWSVHGDEGVCKWPRVRRSSEDPLKKRDKGKADVLAAWTSGLRSSAFFSCQVGKDLEQQDSEEASRGCLR